MNAIDLGFVKARATPTPTTAATTGATYTAFADFNGSGRIDAIDLGAAKARNNDILPAAGGDGAAIVQRPAHRRRRLGVSEATYLVRLIHCGPVSAGRSFRTAGGIGTLS